MLNKLLSSILTTLFDNMSISEFAQLGRRRRDEFAEQHTGAARGI